MAKIKVETKAFLTDLGFTAVEIDDMIPKWAGKEDKLAEMVMRQSDYDKSYTALQQEIKDKNAQLNQEMADFADLKNKDTEAAAETAKRIETLEADKAKLVVRLTRVATEAGIDPKTLLGEEEPPNPDPNKGRKDFDPEELRKLGYVRQEDMAPLVGMNFDLSVINDEHQALFGKRLGQAGMDQIKTELTARIKAKDPNRPADLTAVWQDVFKVADKRTEIATKAHDAEIKAAEARGREAALSEGMTPGSTRPTDRHGSPLFEHGKSKLERPQPGQIARGAAASLRAGTYRGQSIESVRAAQRAGAAK